jgi:hypothetical protein
MNYFIGGLIIGIMIGLYGGVELAGWAIKCKMERIRMLKRMEEYTR